MTRSQELAQNLSKVVKRIENAALGAMRDPSEITLIVVTKNFPVSDAQILYDLGLRNYGENRDQDGALKSEVLPSDAIWHFQGQIQSRKIKSIACWADQVHSLDSLEHARKFEVLTSADPEGQGNVKKFFLQINLEPDRIDRGGVDPERVKSFLETLLIETRIAPVGFMTVAPQRMDPLKAFTKVREMRENCVERFPSLTQLSMGMSGDFETAIACGATHIRIGSSILGSHGLPV